MSKKRAAADAEVIVIDDDVETLEAKIARSIALHKRNHAKLVEAAAIERAAAAERLRKARAPVAVVFTRTLSIMEEVRESQFKAIVASIRAKIVVNLGEEWAEAFDSLTDEKRQEYMDFDYFSTPWATKRAFLLNQTSASV